MQVLHVCSEMFPLLKTGGLADVIGALPAAQIADGVDARVLLPAFPDIRRGAVSTGSTRRISMIVREARITIPTYLPIPTTYCVLRCWGGLGQKWPAGLTHSGVLMWCMRTTGMQALRLRIWRRAGVRRSRCLLCTTWPIKACFMHIT